MTATPIVCNTMDDAKERLADIALQEPASFVKTYAKGNRTAITTAIFEETQRSLRRPFHALGIPDTQLAISPDNSEHALNLARGRQALRNAVVSLLAPLSREQLMMLAAKFDFDMIIQAPAEGANGSPVNGSSDTPNFVRLAGKEPGGGLTF